MLTVPSFILRRLYVRGSLRNTYEGFQFDIFNKLAAGYARKLFPIMVDEQPVPIASCSFLADGTEHNFGDVANDNPLTLAVNKTTIITVTGHTLSEGTHTIGMSFEVPGLGVLKLNFTDVVSNE